MNKHRRPQRHRHHQQHNDEINNRNALLNLINQELINLSLDNFGVNFFVIDKNGFYIYKNNTLYDIVKDAAKADVIDPKAWKISKKVMKERRKIVVEEEYAGTTYLSIKTPLIEQDNVIGVMGISIDITDRKRAEEFKQKAEAAKKVVNFSNLVAGSIAHELKNPLAGIRMQMEVLRTLNLEKIQPKEASPIIDDVTSAIIKTVDNTNYFINGMLKKVRTFATGEAHHTAFEQLSITADVEDLLATYPFTKNEQDLVKTAFNIRFKYLGDKVLTGHVLSNLMKNALHAIAQTDKEDATITIETKEDPSGKFNLLIFRDTATGIPADFVEKIFDQFETKKDVHGGTGLGLAFCKAVMKDNYGGDITCTSKEGKFTEFVLKFPKI